MEGETATLSNSSESRKSVDTISILVVDDDATCLSIVAAILKKFKYEVVTAKHPNDALYALRIKGGAFDLVVSDVHMPDMNGFELQQAIAREFNLPVVLMSADDKEGVASKGLENGAAFFILKPVSPDDLRDLWQFASMKKKSQVVIEETTGNSSDDITVSASSSSVNEGSMNKKDSKKKSPKKEGCNEKRGRNSQSSSQKRPKVTWTNSLHNRFLEAIRSIGLERAVPKKILEVMNVPGLTRENVASHLQKYRIFLRRVSDASYKIQYSADKGLSRNFRTSLESPRTSPSTLMLNRFSRFQYPNPGTFPSEAHVGPFPNPEASSSNLITPSGFGQSRFLSYNGSLLKPNIGNSNLVHQNDCLYARFPDNYQTRNSIQGFSNISLDNLSGSLSASFDASLVGSARINPSTSYEVPYSNKNIGILNTISPLAPSKIFRYQTNYVGYSISKIKHLAGPNEKHREGLNCPGGMLNLPSNESQSSATSVHVTPVPNDNINMDLQLVQNVRASSSSVVENNGGEHLSDVIADYPGLLASNLPLLCGVENGGEIHEPAFSQTFDLSELDNLPSQQPLEEGDFNTTSADQNQAQENRGETITSSKFYSGMSRWDDRVPSYDQAPNQQLSQGLVNSQEFGTSSQLSKTVLLPLTTEKQHHLREGLVNAPEFGASSHLNKTILSPTERDDDDFLESLLAPYGEDQTLEGI